MQYLRHCGLTHLYLVHPHNTSTTHTTTQTHTDVPCMMKHNIVSVSQDYCVGVTHRDLLLLQGFSDLVSKQQRHFCGILGILQDGLDDLEHRSDACVCV